MRKVCNVNHGKSKLDACRVQRINKRVNNAFDMKVTKIRLVFKTFFLVTEIYNVSITLFLKSYFYLKCKGFN